VSRQAFYKKNKSTGHGWLKEWVLLQAVRQIRKRQPRVGARKLHKMLPIHSISVGRDKLFETLRRHDLLVKPTKNYRKTTYSYHRFRTYSNLIKRKEVTAPNQVFVADMTYLRTVDGFCYLSLVTDLYSRKIVGWNLSKSLSIEGCQKALRAALRGVRNAERLIHHSDRGVQYCSYLYVDILKNKNVQISMTEENHCYENAVAERINGILKSEFLLGEKLRSFDDALALTAQSIKTYNEQRLHTSLQYRTPEACYAA
jgi:transposase InsO family protein